MLPSASDVTYFVEVATTLNLSRAAERLGISQPSLSLAMQRLEHAVGAQLFIRHKRGTLLTQAGKQLFAHSRALLQTWDHIKAQALASVDEVQGSFVIGCHPAVGMYSLPQTLPALMKEYPGLCIALKHDLSRKVMEEIVSFAIDLGIVVNPVRHPDLVIKKICEDQVSLWSGDSKAAKSLRTMQEIEDKTLFCDLELHQSQQIIKKLKTKGIHFSRIVPSSSLELIAELAAGGAGFAILPSRVAGKARDSLHHVKDAPSVSDEICLVYRMEHKNVRAVQVIGKALVEGIA